MGDKHRSLASLLPRWRDGVLRGEPPTRWACGDGELADLEVGPGLIVLLGGAPGSGKTALTMQLVVEALRRTPDLRVLFASLEMAPSALLDRALARLSGLNATAIRLRDRDNLDARALEAGFDELAAIADRLAFIDDPSLPAIAEAIDDFQAKLIVVDYLQLVRSPGKHADRRAALDDVLSHCRRFAKSGVGMLALSALARHRGDRGSNYDLDALNLSSFRESSGLEYNADSAYILAPADDDDGMILKHVKNRHGETRDLHLRFDRARQNFLDDLNAAAWSAEASKPIKPGVLDTIKAARQQAKQGRASKTAKPTADRFEGRKDLQ